MFCILRRTDAAQLTCNEALVGSLTGIVMVAKCLVVQIASFRQNQHTIRATAAPEVMSTVSEMKAPMSYC